MSLLNTAIGPERVQVFPVPVGTVQVPGAATSVTAILISTSFSGAPVNTPTAVTDMSTFESAFGGPDDILYGAYYAVEGYFNNAGTGTTALIVNVGTSPTATSFIGNASAGSGLRALDPIDTVNLVLVPGLPLSMKYLVDPAVIDYGKTVRTEFGATLSTTFSLVSIPQEITTASVDKVVLSTTISSVSGTVLTLPSGTNLTSVTPGMTVSAGGVFKAVISAVTPATPSVTLVSLGGLTTSTAITINMPSAVTYKELVVNDPSNAGAWYYNSLVVTDESSTATPGELVIVDSLGHVAGVISRIDSNIAIGGVSHAPAGIQYAAISGIVGLALSVSERMDAAPLRLNFINRITSFPGAGNVIFGGYTADSGTSPIYTSDEELIQVMRTVMFIKASLEPGLRSFIWENFSPDTQQEVSRAIESFLRNNIYLFPAGLPEAQQFQVVSITPTQDELNQGLLRVRVLIRPNTAVRFIEVSLEFPLPTQ